MQQRKLAKIFTKSGIHTYGNHNMVELVVASEVRSVQFLQHFIRFYQRSFNMWHAFTTNYIDNKKHAELWYHCWHFTRTKRSRMNNCNTVHFINCFTNYIFFFLFCISCWMLCLTQTWVRWWLWHTCYEISIKFYLLTSVKQFK